MPRIPPPLLVTVAGGSAALLVGLLAGCTADDPAPLPTGPSGSTTAPAGRINIQYFGDDGSTGLVFVEEGGKVLGKTKSGQTTCTLGTEVGAVSVLDPRVVSAADTVNQLIADVAAEPASRTVCT